MRPLALALIASLTTVAPQFAGAQQLSADGEAAGTKVTIRGLTRDEGGTVTLRFQVSTDRDKEQDLYHMLHGQLDGRVHLLDAGNKKKYLVVKDSSGKCECATVRGYVSKDSPVNLWAKFPAPPENVQKVTVVISGFEPLEQVPITAR
jgi:hypothetical protein